MSNTSAHRAHVTWDGDRQDLRAHTINVSGQTFAGSSAVERGGDPTKADPEEMFVAALSACHMLWFLDYTRRERLRVLSYEDQAEGTMDDERFVSVTLRPRVRFATVVADETIKALHALAHKACFIANSVSCDVQIEPV